MVGSWVGHSQGVKVPLWRGVEKGLMWVSAGTSGMGLTHVGFLDYARYCTDGVISTPYRSSIDEAQRWPGIAQCFTGNGRDQDSKLGLHTPESTVFPADTGPPSQSELPLSSGGEALCSGRSIYRVSARGLCPFSMPGSLWHRPRSCPLLYPLPRVPHAVTPEGQQRILRPPLCLEMHTQVASSEGKGEKIDVFL